MAIPVRSWACHFSVFMVGNTYEFFRHGYDAWDGEGTIYCTNTLSGKSESLRHFFSFRSWTTSYGADTRSSFIIESLSFVVDDPINIAGAYDAQRTTLQTDEEVLSYVILSSANVQMSVAVRDPTIAESLYPSIKWGSLTIAPAPRID